MGTKTTYLTSNELDFCNSEKRIPKHRDENKHFFV